MIHKTLHLIIISKNSNFVIFVQHDFYRLCFSKNAFIIFLSNGLLLMMDLKSSTWKWSIRKYILRTFSFLFLFALNNISFLNLYLNCLACKDTRKQCSILKKADYCNKYPAHMKKVCRSTCEFCKKGNSNNIYFCVKKMIKSITHNVMKMKILGQWW